MHVISGVHPSVSRRYILKKPVRIFKINREIWHKKEALKKYIIEILPLIKNLDALMFCSSFLVPEVINILKLCGIDIPRKLSFLALGGLIDYDYHDPPITVFEHNFEKMARLIYEYMFNIFENKITPISRYYIDCLELVKRQSVIKKL